VSRCAWLGALLAAAPAAAQQSHLLVVAGLGGEPRFRDAFHEQAVTLAMAAEKQLGLAAESVVCLTEDPKRAPDSIDARSSREAVLEALQGLGARSAPGDSLFLVLIGHGSYRGDEARFNLPGPDLTPADLSPYLDRLSGRQVVLVSTASASGPFGQALAGPGRIMVTATKSGLERNETVFGEHFVAALTGDVADVDKDGRTSVLEAFDYARREVERFYGSDKRLQTEHAVLDDDGDGKASAEPDADGEGDGSLARRAFLGGGEGAAGAEPLPEDPALAALYRGRRELEQRIDALRDRREALGQGDYAARLEGLLLELAMKNEEIDTAEAGR
jgi:hypothetical protein